MAKPKPTALIFVSRTDKSDVALDLRHAVAVAEDLRLHVLSCYVTGPMRPNALQDLVDNARAQQVAPMVIVARVEPDPLDSIRQACTVLVAGTGETFPRYGLALASAVSAGMAEAGA
ncbi:hypothetical protein ACW9HR_37375 [Nocardia gipuzkoensis]